MSPRSPASTSWSPAPPPARSPAASRSGTSAVTNIACSGRSAAWSLRCMRCMDDRQPHGWSSGSLELARMINAAILGLGWWGKTLVESGENSEALRFVAAATRTQSPEVQAFVEQKSLRLAANYQALLADPQIDAVVLATPHSMHAEQVIAAAGAKKHVFCEKPFTLTKREAEGAVAAVRKAGVTLGLGYNRRFHPEMIKLRDMIRAGELGTILHVEATMTFPNALFLQPDAWRANPEETPAGGLTPMGVHAVDGMIDL